MKIAINLKPLALLCLSVAVVSAGVYLLHEIQVRRSAFALLHRAEKVASEGKKSEELDLLRRYLAYRPDDIDALEKYGLSLAGSTATEDQGRAIEALDRVLKRDPGRAEVRRKVADLARDLGRIDEARVNYEILATSQNGDAAAEEAVGRCEEALKRYPEAVSWLEKAITHDPSRIEAHARLARLLRVRLGNAGKADIVMDARQIGSGVIAKNPKSARGYLERASYRQDFAIPGVADDIQQAIQLAPDDADVLMAASREAPDQDAIRLMTHGIEVHPDDPRFYEAIAFREARVGDRVRAIDLLSEGLRRLPKETNLRWLLAEIEIDAGRQEAAAVEIKKLREKEKGISPAALDFLDARILVESRQWTEAARQLARTAPTLESLPGAAGLAKRAFLMLARCHFQLGNPDMRYSAARRAVALEVADLPLAISARAELASALAGLGKLDQAAEEYRVALRMPAATASLLVELGRVLVAKNLRLPPKLRQWDEVEAVLSQSEAALPGSAELAVLRAEILAAQERLDAAGDRLKQAETAHPDDVGPRVAQAALAERRGKSGEALSILEEARKRLGERPALLSALIQYWSSRPGEAGSRALTGMIDAASGISDESERRSVLTTLADGLDRVGDAARAASIRDRLVAEQPDHLGLRLAQLDAALRLGDFATAGRILDEVRRIEGPEGSLWRYGRAQMLIQASRKERDPKGLDEARMLLAEARQRRPGWARAMLAAAELDDLRGDAGSALRGYLDALENGERDPGAVRRAVQLLYGRGRFAQADALLGRVQQEGTLSPELGRLAADVALQVRDDDRAIDLARQAVAGRPDSASDQTWLGRLLFAASRKATERGQVADAEARRLEAENALVRGVELAPADPDSQTALILALAAWGRIDDARQAIRKAEATLKGPAAELAIARCFEAVGRPQEAEARYQAILKARPDDVPTLQASAIAFLRVGKIGDAEPLLRRLIALRSKTPREAAWARRVLALALTVEGRGGSSKARELLGLDDESVAGALAIESRTDLTADDIRARAQVLARQPGRSSRRKAIAMIENLTSRDEARPNDLFLRAQLVAADGDWKRARASVQQLLVEDPSNPTLLEFLARGQIASGNPAEASPWIDELTRLRPGSPVIDELKARALFASKKGDEAVALLGELARKEPTLGLKIAGLLEESARLAEAEALLVGLASGGPSPEAKVDASLAFAGFLGRRTRHAEAIEICEKLWADPKVAPERVSSVALIALYSGQPEARVLGRVEGGIAAALARKPGDIGLRFDSANLAILMGRHAEAESTLRDLHKAEPNLGAPLNNLAWLMALRGGRGSEPLDLVDRAIALDGPQPGLLDTRGLVLTLQGQPDRAIDDLEESIAADPSPTGYLHLALALRKAGKPAEAADAMNKARSSGLRAGDVHPLERPFYLELISAYPEK
jgi:tetratricopeptide (TPR) repeat protein